MALFNTPSLLGHIFAPQQFPQDGGGIETLMSGLSAGSSIGAQYKVDRADWKETGTGRKPTPFQYFVATKEPMPGHTRGNRAGLSDNATANYEALINDLNKTIDALSAALRHNP